MKLSASILATLAGVCLTAQAATISLSNLPGGTPVPIGNSGGTLISAASGFAALGTFPAGTDFSNGPGLVAAFQQFGDAVGFVADGIYSNQVTATVGGTSFSGANVYTVIGSGDLASASELLIIDHGFTFADEPDATGPGGNVLAAADANLQWGSTGGPYDVRGTMFDGLNTAVIIPEPSSALLGLLGLSFLAFRRRK